MLTPRVLPTTFLKFAAACACLLTAGAHAAGRAQGEPKQSRPAVASAASAAGGAAARGIELFDRGEYEAAVKSLREATKREKSDAGAWHYLGLALVKRQKFKDARKAFERAVALRQTFAAALAGLAYAHLRLNETYEAGSAAGRALALEPGNLEARYILGITHLRHDSNSQALAAAEAALKVDPAFAPALYLKVVALAGLSAKAVSSATDETQDVRKVLLDKVGARVDEADAALGQFAALEPQNPEIESLGEQLKTLRVYSASFGASPAAGGDILSSKEVTTKAQILRRPEPSYTERARQSQTRGAVLLRMVLSSDGVVRHIVAVRRLPDGLTEQAIAAARKIRFTPATKDGRPVSQYVTIEYNFNIY